jgi:putative DNA primase/helicase
MIFTAIDVPFDPDADCSDFERMMLVCMADDRAMARFMQLLLGYGITGEVCEELFAVFTGSGRNGKGGITQTLARVLGPVLYKAMNSGLICERQVSNVDAERGKLLGARVAVFDELADGEKLKTQEVQLITGGDGIPARPLYHDPMTITPRHLCILATNHMPQLSVVLPAMVLRILVVPFLVTFVDLLPGEEPTQFRRQIDPGLKARLAANPAGVLRWLVDGAVAWYALPGGLRREAPPQVLGHGRLYFVEQDRLAAFVAQRCRLGADLAVPTADLLLAYNAANDDAKLSAKSLAAAMRVKGFDKGRARQAGSINVNVYQGLELLSVVF